MFDSTPLIRAISGAAEAWSDPEYEARVAAVAMTLDSPNAFTEEAVAFAVNWQMSLLTEEHLSTWLSGRATKRKLTVGVLNAGNVPLVELQDFLAVVLTGHRYLGSVSSKSPVLFPSFLEDVRSRAPSLEADIVPAEDIVEFADAVLATGGDETMKWIEETCEANGIDSSRRLLRGSGFAAAVLDGRESDNEYEQVAEDVLLHEGFGCRNVAVIWAPEGLSPDPLLDAFAHFRGVFPAHPSTPGRLKMQQAFLAAIITPHAYGEGLEFLLSKGAPEVQAPGHVRWSEYKDLTEVREWIREAGNHLQLVVARSDLAGLLGESVEAVSPGYAQRAELSWCPGGTDTVEFLSRLS